MSHRSSKALIATAAYVLLIAAAVADAPKELSTQKNRSVVLGNFTNAPNNCTTNPGAVPLPRLFEKPSHGAVGLQVVMADVAATDACPAPKIPSIALFYTPEKDFVGKDSVRIELEIGDKKLPDISFLISVQDDVEKREGEK